MWRSVYLTKSGLSYRHQEEVIDKQSQVYDMLTHLFY